MAEEPRPATSQRRVSFVAPDVPPGVPITELEEFQDLQRTRSYTIATASPHTPESASFRLGQLNQGNTPRRASVGKIVDELDALRDRAAPHVSLPGLESASSAPGGGVIAAAAATAADVPMSSSMRLRRDMDSRGGRRPSLSPAFERSSVSRQRDRSSERPPAPERPPLFRSGSASGEDGGLQIFGQHVDSSTARCTTPGNTSMRGTLRHGGGGSMSASGMGSIAATGIGGMATPGTGRLHLPPEGHRNSHSPLLHPVDHLRTGTGAAGSHPSSPASCPSPLPAALSSHFAPLTAASGASPHPPRPLHPGSPPLDSLLDSLAAGDAQLQGALDQAAAGLMQHLEALNAAREAAAARSRSLREAAEAARRPRPSDEAAAVVRELQEAAAAMAEQEQEAAAGSETATSVAADRARQARAAIGRAIALLG